MRPECPVQDQVSTTTTLCHRARWLHGQSPPAPAVATNTYPRPIPTPIDNLRPARDTCEQCHWPSHFSGDKQYVNTYFQAEEDNTRWTIALLMKIGGAALTTRRPVASTGT